METVRMPKRLTAENGAKALLAGEFYETIEVDNPDYCDCGNDDWCDRCDNLDDKTNEGEPEFTSQRIPVSWTTIKEIYKMAVDHLEVKSTGPPEDPVEALRSVIPDAAHYVIRQFRTKSAINDHRHWRAKRKETTGVRDLVTMFLKMMAPDSGPKLDSIGGPWVACLVRTSPRKLDSGDNLESSLKPVRDAVADVLLPHDAGNQHRTWADDSGSEIAWRCYQRKGDSKEHRVDIFVARQESVAFIDQTFGVGKVDWDE